MRDLNSLNNLNNGGKFRPPAIPLITIDPYFNIWSFEDNLYDDFPRHWTGRRNSLTGLLRIDGIWYRFMGKVELNPENYYSEPPVINQISADVLPLKTSYVFENEKVRLNLDFTSPLFPGDLYLMSRPFSYIDYNIESNDGKEHEVKIYMDITSEAAVDNSDQEVFFGRVETNKYSPDKKKKELKSVYCSCNSRRQVLSRSGDDHRIDWGFLHLIAPGQRMFAMYSKDKAAYLNGVKFKDLADNYDKHLVKDAYPALCMSKKSIVSGGGKNNLTGFVTLGYDDVKSIEYFGKQLDAYWKKDGETFGIAMDRAVKEHGDIIKRADRLNADLQGKARKISEKYCDIISLAYRQVIAAHKLTWDGEEMQFFSKECFSNGCIGTVDVTYPSIPLFLIYNPELVKGMLNPVFKYASSKHWEYDFAPHDVGQYPLANGQVYGYNSKLREMSFYHQMPVEECGNMILCVAAVCEKTGNVEYAEKHSELLGKWADYLVKSGWDPENQLCTDDFAGHLARNCNLSIKAILAIAAWGKLLNKMGRSDESSIYLDKAAEMAKEWQKAALDTSYESGGSGGSGGEHYKLTFDRDNSWSMKYNLVWDKLLKLNVFDKKIAETEVNYYKTKINAYGLPLDIRNDYTKSDWQMWSTVLTKDADYTNQIINAMWDRLCLTGDRTPFTDFYFTSNTKQVGGMQNRTVQGGLFINLLKF